MAYALRSPADAACWLVTLTWLLIGAILSPEPRCVRLTPPPAGPAFWLVIFSHLSLDVCGWLRPQLVLHSDWSYSLTWASMRAADSAPSWSCILIGHILSPEPRCVRLTPPPAGPWVAAPERWPPASAAAAGPAVAVVTASDDGRWAAAVRCVGTSPRAWPARTWASWSCPRQRRRQAAKHKHADRLLIIRNICFDFLLDSFLCRHICFILLTLFYFLCLADNVKCSQTIKFHFTVPWWYLAKKVIFFYGRNRYHCIFILVQLINNKSNLTGWPSVCPKWQGQMSGPVSVAWDCGSTIRWPLGLLLKPALLQYDHRCLIDD